MKVTIVGDFGSHEFDALANTNIPDGAGELIMTAIPDGYMEVIVSDIGEVSASLSIGSLDWVEFTGEIVEVIESQDSYYKFKIKGDFRRIW